jgi:hypothetical protein
MCSIFFVGVLAYLYTPLHLIPDKNLESQALVISGEEWISTEVVVQREIATDNITARRIRYTNILLRYQKSLADLESQNTSPSAEVAEKLEDLRIKIQNIEKIITELAR